MVAHQHIPHRLCYDLWSVTLVDGPALMAAMNDAERIERVAGSWGEDRMHFTVEGRDTRFEGEVASEAYAKLTGATRAVVVGRGDGGVDYPDGTNVKATVWFCGRCGGRKKYGARFPPIEHDTAPRIIVNRTQDHAATVRCALFVVVIDKGARAATATLHGIVPKAIIEGFPAEHFGRTKMRDPRKIADINHSMPHFEVVKYHASKPQDACAICAA